MERKCQTKNKRVFSGSGNNIVKTPIKTTGANRLEEENKRLKSELIRKERIIQDYQRRINSLNKTVNELRAKLNQSKSNHSRAPQRSSTNNNNNYHGSDFDEFTNNFFRNPELLFSDMFGQGQTYAPQFEDNVYQQEPSNLEEDIINQLYPNPDNMTYEQLLALEEQVGSVSKGLTKNEISVSLYFFYNNIFRKFLLFPFRRKITKTVINVRYVSMSSKRRKE